MEIDRWHRPRGFAWIGYLLPGDHSACERSIGYHFVILGPRQFPELGASCPVLDGQIQPGRPVEAVGAHAVGRNSSSIGICLVGREEFSDAQFAALHRLVTYLCGSLGLSTTRILGHYEVQAEKTCPNLPMGLIRDWLSDPAGACAQSITSLQGALLAERARRKG
jgi:hypothetical protein